MLESVKTTLLEIIEAAGDDGVTEGQAVSALGECGLGYYETLDALKSACKELPGIERTPEHTGQLIYYRKTKQQPEETNAEKIARKSAQRIAGEKQRMNILNQYRR